MKLLVALGTFSTIGLARSPIGLNFLLSKIEEACGGPERVSFVCATCSNAGLHIVELCRPKIKGILRTDTKNCDYIPIDRLDMPNFVTDQEVENFIKEHEKRAPVLITGNTFFGLFQLKYISEFLGFMGLSDLDLKKRLFEWVGTPECLRLTEDQERLVQTIGSLARNDF